MSGFSDRWYQIQAEKDFFQYIKEGGRKPSIITSPTGSGKTAIISRIIKRLLRMKPSAKVLIISDRKSIIKQNKASMKRNIDVEVSAYSASVSEKIVSQITVGGIHSIYNKPHLFENFDLILVDECHLVNNENKGMFRKFLGNMNRIVVGLTATPFRTGQGYLTDGDYWETICSDINQYFLRLLDEKFLCPLVPKRTDTELNTDGIKTTAGDFDEKEMAERFDREWITKAAVKEIVESGTDRKKWLIFAINIKHAENIKKEFSLYGIKSETVHSKMKKDYDSVISDHVTGEIRALINVNMLTTGYDDTGIDLIAMLRPTKSAIFHCQTGGRGLRVDDTKDDCLFMDFAGNTKRLGPINDPYIKPKGKRKGPGGDMAKVCEACETINHLSAKVCIYCGAPFPIKEKITKKSDTKAEIIKREKEEKEPEWVEIDDTVYNEYENKKGKGVKVTYYSGLKKYNEWVCLEYNSNVRFLARSWIKFRWSGDKNEIPGTVDEFIKNSDKFIKPSELKVTIEKRPEIVDYLF